VHHLNKLTEMHQNKIDAANLALFFYVS